MWGFEFTSKDAALQRDSAEIAPTLHEKYWVLVTDWLVFASYPFLEQPSPVLFLIYFNLRENFESTTKEPFSGILTW